MDLISMNISNWWILFGVLVIIPGSTLNVIEREAVTAEEAGATTLIPLILKTVVPINMEMNTEANTLRTYRKSKEISKAMTSDALHPEESTTAPTLAQQLSLDIVVKAKASMTSLTTNRQGKDELSLQYFHGNLHKTFEDATFSIMPTTKTTMASAEANLFNGSSKQSITEVDATKRTKGSLNPSETIGKGVGRKGVGRADEAGVLSNATDSTRELTLKSKVTIRNTLVSKIESTLLSSTKMASATKLLLSPLRPQPEVKLFPISSINNDYAHQYHQNITDARNPYRGYNINNTKCYYNYIYNKTSLVQKDDGKHSIVDEHDMTQQPHAFPLQRTQSQSNSRHSYDYHLNNGNSNYSVNQVSTASVMTLKHQTDSLRNLRRQRTRQVQQKHYNLTTITLIRATGMLPNNENYLIGNDTDTISIVAFSNQTVKNKNNASRSSKIFPTILTTRPYTDSTMKIAIVADGQEVVSKPSFPTVSPTTTKPTTRRSRPTTTPLPTPSIDDYQTVLSQAGTHAYLPCKVKQILRKPISWLRIRDGHILTVDQTTFIADQRFQPIFTTNPERWSLQIKYVQLKDEGTYECQVSTEPKSSAIVALRVVEPKTELLGEPTQNVVAGSQVKLRCIISQALDPPVFINWFHNQKQIYMHNRKGWRTEIERIELPIQDFSTTAETTTSTMSIPTITTPVTTAQIESATTITPPIEAAAASSAQSTTTVMLLATNFENVGDSTSVVQVIVRDVELTAVTPSTTLPLSSLGTDLATDLADSDTANSTFSLPRTMTAAMDTMATAVPTKIKMTHCPTAALTITTTSTVLAAVEVREVTTASLIMPSVEKKDSGNYTCSPSNSASKTVVLHVLNGEYSASAIMSGVNGKISTDIQCKWQGKLFWLIIWHWYQHFYGIFNQLRIPLSSGMTDTHGLH